MVTRPRQTCCPFCSYLHNPLTSALPSDVDPPVDGGISLCIHCGEFCEFQSGALIIPSEETYEEIHRSRDVLRLKEVWQATRAERL